MAGAGNLDQRITFQRAVKTPDGIGGTVVSFVDFTTTPTVWASVTPVRGGERFEEDRTNATSIHVVTIRWRDDLDETDRIIWRGEPFNIRAIHRVSKRKINLSFDVERGVAN